MAAGLAVLAVACSTPQATVSVIPPSVSTRPPPAPSASPSAAKPLTLARSVPVRIRIPAIGVSAPVMELGLNSDRTIQVPPLANLNLAGWYKYDATPGAKGAAVIVGHIDSTAGAAVFYRLRYLTKGERIYVTLADGKTAVFAVDGLQQTLKTAFPTDRVYGPVPYAGLRLVTCGGAFDAATGHYLSNIIAYAHLV